MIPLNHHDLGAELFKTWSEAERRAEISKLVEGYRAGLPVGILCKMTETIAGSEAQARAYLAELLTPEERQTAIARETGGMLLVVRAFLG
ncbi:MAG TPA: hypothetical protein VIU41_12165 [Geobacteraceae bacterium]